MAANFQIASHERLPQTDRNMDLTALHRGLGIAPDYAAARSLPLQSEAGESELVAITSFVISPENDSHPLANLGHEIRLRRPAAAAWERLRNAALRDAIALVPLSGFRSIARQAEIIRAKLAAGLSIAAILEVNAAPGYSEHHTGCAIDLGTPDDPPLEASFANTAAFRWLSAHAGEFSFKLSYPLNNEHGIAFEPWHWCWHE